MRRSGITCLGLFLVLAAALPAVAQVAPIDAPFEIAPAEGSHTSPPLLAGGPISDPSMAVSPDGGFVITWERDGEILVGAWDRDGQARIPAFAAAPKDPILIRTEPGVAVGADGAWIVVWREVELPPTGYDVRIMGRRFGADGTPGADPLRLDEPTYDNLTDPEVAALPDGGFLAVWTLEYVPNFEPIGETSYFVTRRFDGAGEALAPSTALRWGGEEARLFHLPGDEGFVLARQGSPSIVDSQRLDTQGNGLPRYLTPAMLPQFEIYQSLAIDPAGRLLLVGTDRLHPRVNAKLYDVDRLQALGPAFALPTAKPPLSQPYLASARPGQFLMVWEDKGRWVGEVQVAGCGEPHLGLCLEQNRFRVEVSWRDHQGNTGQGHAVPLQDDTGSFWFFTPANVELLVKVLDGRSINSHFWVFYGSLSDVEFDIRVTDTQTGDVQIYHNSAGTLASQADVHAFPPDPDPDPPAPSTAAALSGGVREIIAPLSPPAVCHSSEESLCLDPLYRVTIDFVDPQTGDVKQARAVPFSQESGAFWFFGPDNLEIFVKVLDGTAVNGHTWVFYGALTDVEYTLRVRDLLGAEWTYHNRRGQMSSGADTSALPPPVRF
jgi:hypothetical protein